MLPTVPAGMPEPHSFATRTAAERPAGSAIGCKHCETFCTRVAEFCEGKIYDNSEHSVLFSRDDRFGTRVCQICISICDGVCGRDVKFKKLAQEAEQVCTQLVAEPKGLFRSVSYRFVMFRAQRKSCWARSVAVTERSLRDSCCGF